MSESIYIIIEDDKLVSYKNRDEALKVKGYIDIIMPADKYSGKYVLSSEKLYIFPILEEYKKLAKNAINQYLSYHHTVYADFEIETFSIQYSGAKDLLDELDTENATFVENLYKKLDAKLSLQEFCKKIVLKHEEDEENKITLVSDRNNLWSKIDSSVAISEIESLLKTLSIDPCL